MTNTSEEATVANININQDNRRSFIATAIATFTTVFIAELGDKTQIATLLFSAQSGKPVTVFLGASLALILTSLIGVLIGRWISKVLPPELFSQIAGFIMIFIGLIMGTESAKMLFFS